jgi:hypothetical protein
MSEKDQPGKHAEYDPELHAGALTVDGHLIIIEEAGKDGLRKLRPYLRKALIESTTQALELMALSEGIGGVHIEFIDPDKAAVLQEGYRKGLRILGAEPPDTTQFFK